MNADPQLARERETERKTQRDMKKQNGGTELNRPSDKRFITVVTGSVVECRVSSMRQSKVFYFPPFKVSETMGGLNGKEAGLVNI